MFSGTKSIGRAFEARGWEVVSLDMNKKANPDICCDIMAWLYPGAFPVGHFDYIHASPPCTHYSIARTTGGPRDFEGANAIVLRTLQIIEFFKPRYWTLENPQTGYLKIQPFMQLYPYVDACYCRYSDGVNHRYRKCTRFWGVHPWVPRPLCTRADPCEYVQDGRHPVCAQKFAPTGRPPMKHSQNQLYSIPDALCDELSLAVVWGLQYSGDQTEPIDH